MTSDISRLGLLIVTWILAALATILTVFRLYVRRTKLRQFYWDDAFHCFAWAMLIASAGVYTSELPLIYEVTAVAQGTALLDPDFLEDQVPRYIDLQFVSYVLFYLTVWSVKFAFLLFYRRFFLHLKNLMIALWTVTAFTAIAFLSQFVLFLEVCGSAAAYFQISACLSQQSSARTKLQIKYSTSVDVLSDVMIMALPLHILRALRITIRQKIGLATCFALGFIVVIFSIVRAVEILDTLTGLSSLERADPISLTLWSALESSIAVIVSCLPSLRILFLGTTENSRYRDRPTPTPPSSFKKPPRMQLVPLTHRVCARCGNPRPRAWLPSKARKALNSASTMTSSRGQWTQASKETAKTDTTLVASPQPQPQPQPQRDKHTLSPIASLESPRLAHIDSPLKLNKPLPEPPQDAYRPQISRLCTSNLEEQRS